MALIHFDDARLIRGGNLVLRGIDLTIAEGQHTAILGPNGSGKSSLLSLITRERYPVARDDGASSVSILGQHTWDVFSLRTQLGIVTHDMERFFTADGVVTCFDVVLSGFFASKGVGAHHVVTADMHERARRTLDLMEVAHLAEREIATLSTGEARRVLIARALVNDPRALLLDEPTEGLDLMRRRSFLESLRHVAHAGKTLLLITHHVEEIVPEIQHVVLLREGRVFRQGAKADILTSEMFSALFNATVAVEKRGEYFSAAVDTHATRL